MKNVSYILILLIGFFFSITAFANNDTELKKIDNIFDVLAGITELKSECRLDYNLEAINELASHIAKSSGWSEVKTAETWKLNRKWFADKYSEHREVICIVIRKTTYKWWPDGIPDILQ